MPGVPAQNRISHMSMHTFPAVFIATEQHASARGHSSKQNECFPGPSENHLAPSGSGAGAFLGAALVFAAVLAK